MTLSARPIRLRGYERLTSTNAVLPVVWWLPLKAFAAVQQPQQQVKCILLPDGLPPAHRGTMQA
jgi:hypothetical protein